MAAYSMDLRLRMLRDADAGMPSDELEGMALQQRLDEIGRR
jgi:hypothetical protein